MNEQEQDQLYAYLMNHPMEFWPSAIKLQKALGYCDRVDDAMSTTQPSDEQMKLMFQNGRIPCSFSLQLLWEPILTQLDHFNQALAKKRDTITNQKGEPLPAEEEKTLLAEIEEDQLLGIDAYLPFVRSAAQMEKKLVLHLERQLEKDRNCLSGLLGERRTPKLSLLLNCFGADAETIRTLGEFNSEKLLMLDNKDLKSGPMEYLRGEQQVIVLYTRERLKKGKLPFAKHDCAVCKCTTAEEMANFLHEHGLEQVTADIIRQTGASGRGALLFFSTKDLQLRFRDQFALTMSRRVHRWSKN